jgi:hypothetical protein
VSGDGEPIVIADERDHMQAALGLMRDAFTDLLFEYQRNGDWEKQGEFQHRFFDGYAEAKRIWGVALVKRDVLGKPQPPLDVERDEERAVDPR